MSAEAFCAIQILFQSADRRPYLMSAAQNQHYVPKFILRHFLSNEQREQVAVFDKKQSRIFVTSIKNVMAERRFNDVSMDDKSSNFEENITKIESICAPTYESIIRNERLSLSLDEKERLAILITLQYLRTKNSRSVFSDIDEAIKIKFGSNGNSINEIKGWRPLTDEMAKLASISSLVRDLPRLASILRNKTFFLMKCSSARYFYLGDDPVCLHNDRNFGVYGNLGFAVPGIQISLPLSSGLLLCAWCQTIFSDLETEAEKCKQYLIAMLSRGHINAAELRRRVEVADQYRLAMVQAVQNGTPLELNSENMDWYNSLQMATANRYVICKRSDFDLAKRSNRDHPNKGRKIAIS